ncbi:MAG: dihydroorotase [Candidatus Improbicoccus devescovinae]|nr:MAG: dihydroorotase [Candidatus Improbicoccus devescovinae]
MINAENLIICPGFLDLHVHFREPGYEYKETISTGSRAAISGGYTQVCCMPNTMPPIDSSFRLSQQLEIISSNAFCEVLPFVSMTVGRLGKNVDLDFLKCLNNFAGISDDGGSVENDQLMEKICRFSVENDILISAHCELSKSFPKKESEFEYLQRDLILVEKYRCRYHAQHISCVESLNLITQAKYDGLPVTCEVTPHHALISNEQIADVGEFKMSPPLRSEFDRKNIVENMLNGTVDAIATDHAPHSKYEKSLGYYKSLNGVSGLECAFAVLHTGLVVSGIMSLQRLIFLMTQGPAKILKKPEFSSELGIKIGARANLTIIDEHKVWKVNSEKFFSKGKSTPFNNQIVVGKVVGAILNGKIMDIFPN